MAEKILIVDDDAETLRLVGLMLQRQGYQVVSASNGAQAIQMVTAEKPDLVILDVMMPDIDGFQVTQQLRANPETAYVSILMFTAKSQVEDKVVGYEAGVDDYLTKPIHPAELTAHVRSLLARGKTRPGGAKSDRGYTLGVIAPRGGMGASSLVLNLGIALHTAMSTEVVAAELRPGQGSWAIDLGFAKPTGLNNLLRRKPAEITASVIEQELVRTTLGPRLLMASNDMKDVELIAASAQMQAILQNLPTLSPITLLDFGHNVLPNFESLMAFCTEVIVLSEPFPISIQRSRLLMDELAALGFGKSKLMSVVVLNRVRADMQLSIPQMQEMLGVNPLVVIPPAPEQAYQAGLRNIPLINVQPDGLVALQFKKLAEIYSERIQTK